MKKAITAALLLVLCLLCACSSDKENKYQAYVRSLIDANYLGKPDEYMDVTGAARSEAEAAYYSTVMRLADNLSSYYGISTGEDTEIEGRFTDLARAVYGKTRYEVSPVRTEEGVSYVDVTIYPMDLLNTTHEQILSYISDLDSRVAAGEFNDTVKEDYMHQLGSGILDILDTAAQSMTYKDPVTVSVRIISGKNDYYISDADFKAIDAAIIATKSE